MGMKRGTSGTSETQHGKRPKSSSEDAWGAKVPKAPHYDFVDLCKLDSDFAAYATQRHNGTVSVDFGSRDATRALTCAILRQHYQIELRLPPAHLVPTIPNRVQYLTWAASLLEQPENVCALDIGTGPSCIYPLLGSRLFPKWKFIATDTDAVAVNYAKQNVHENGLVSRIDVVATRAGDPMLDKTYWQTTPQLVVCNPPFHETMPQTEHPAGTAAQLATAGGEYAFLCELARDSVQYAHIACLTSLVGRKADLPKIVSFLKSDEVRATRVCTAEISQGGRTVRWAVAWSFGAARTVAEVQPDQSDSRWRASCSILASRRYANRLTLSDLRDVCLAAFSSEGWALLPCKQENSGAVVRNVGDSRQQTRITFACSKADRNSAFSVLFKVDERGAMQPFAISKLAASIADIMREIMDDT